MVTSTQRSPVPKPAGQPPAADTTAKPNALKGMSFAEGEKALAPAENKTGPNAQPPAEKAAPAMKPRDVLDAWDVNRTEGLSVEYMSAVQTALGVDATGASTKELVVKLAELQDAKGWKGKVGKGQLKSSVRTWLASQFPELAAVPQKPKAEARDQGPGERVSGNKGAPEDEALKQLGRQGYVQYVGTFKAMTFLGHTVIGHPEFLARVENAKAYLKKTLEADDAQIGGKLGITRVSHYRPSSATSDQMYHGLGFALDVNPVKNDWNFGSPNAGIRQKMSDTMKHVGDLFGESVIRGAGDMSKNARAGTTDDAFDKVDASNDALKRYRALAGDMPKLEAFLASDKAGAKAKSKKAAQWMKTIQDDEKWLAKRMATNDTADVKGGFTDLNKEVVKGLRDAGGLRWGGTDLGGDNGDLMHFDGGTMDTARGIRNKVKQVRAEAAAKPKDAATTASPG